MQNELFERPHRRHIKEINIVPILDMLTTIIFFLLLSASFIEYSKVTVPPSKVNVSTDPVKPPPLQPRLSVTVTDTEYHVLLNWSGTNPGRVMESVPVGSDEVLTASIEKILQEFKAAHAEENTLQMGLGSAVPYQALIVTMDAARKSMADIVLYSYLEAEMEWRSQSPNRAGSL